MARKPKKKHTRVAGETPVNPTAAEPAAEPSARDGLREASVADAEEELLPTLDELDANLTVSQEQLCAYSAAAWTLPETRD